MSGTNPKVDAYLKKAKNWREEMEALREVFLKAGLTEELKWAKPCYTFGTGNVVIVLALKERCALVFFKGSLIKDPHGLLIRPTENTEIGRQMRFTSVKEIAEKGKILRDFVAQAIAIEKSGVKIETKKVAEVKMPEELEARLKKDAAFKKAFQALTPGRQRGYIFYFSGAKQAKTRESRIEKCAPQILQGKGLMD